MNPREGHVRTARCRPCRALRRHAGPRRSSLLAAACALLGAPLLLATCGGEGEIEQPTPLYGEVPIEYPLQLWDQDMEGETLLRVRVSDTGAVDSVVVVESSGYAAFDSAAVAGAWNLRFTPARQDGERIRVWAHVPVRFSKRPRPDTTSVVPIAEGP